MTWLLAHGIGGIRDLPVPRYVFFSARQACSSSRSSPSPSSGGSRCWPSGPPAGRCRPALAAGAALDRVCASSLGAVSFALLVFLWLGALIGEDDSGVNFTPTFVYVSFWVGMVLVVALLGNVWRVLDPWRAAAEGSGLGHAAARAPRRGRRSSTRSGSAAGRPRSCSSRSWRWSSRTSIPPTRMRSRWRSRSTASITWFGAAAFGAEAWFRNGDGFSVYFQLLSRISPFGRREDGQLVARVPFSGLVGQRPDAGTIAFVAVMLGSTFFDGFSRTSIWQNRYYDVQVDLLDSPDARRPARAADERRRPAPLRRVRRLGVPARGRRHRVDRRAASALARRSSSTA